MKKLISIILTVLVSVLFICGCGDRNKKVENNKIIIAASIAPETTFIEKVCGDGFEVLTVIPTGASPETYEPTPSIMKKLNNASLYFSIGVPAEENSILPIISKTTPVISLHKDVAKIYPELKIGNGRDPHIWLSPKRVIAMVEIISDKLSQSYPENSELFKSNAAAYINELKNLDLYIHSTLDNNKNRDFLVFHPAFGYFAEEYSLNMIALEKDGKEATAKQLAEMTDFAKQKNIKVIFYQAESSKRQALAFAEEIDGQAVMLEPLSKDYITSLKKMTDYIGEAIK